MPLNLTRDFEAKIYSQTCEIQSVQRDLLSTLDSPNSWDELNLSSIQGVCVDECVGTWTSSVSRITEPAICHLSPAEGGPKLFQLKQQSRRKAAPIVAAVPSTPSAREKQRHILLTNCFNQQNLEDEKMSFKSEVSHSSHIPWVPC